ncbi:hypothetical protein BO94DRAFT_207215 [Aspergillus sclerotioniger CBS 115572]|uniref:Uncharacterized protein n=1 Tax=Aspergillus sclerotioniger CBS 115572 TaxID=1450535 RepID=A0A317VNT9_9EURO|nr:hypothetical protein BO94DRAFT_207215 [Aspergillus sclerotioniger CBS 115572]PWY75996.1 hypothetical protein BO94DRAFT_207215 [Aspergillus sclerotioniger CBS 115572]
MMALKPVVSNTVLLAHSGMSRVSRHTTVTRTAALAHHHETITALAWSSEQWRWVQAPKPRRRPSQAESHDDALRKPCGVLI